MTKFIPPWIRTIKHNLEAAEDPIRVLEARFTQQDIDAWFENQHTDNIDALVQAIRDVYGPEARLIIYGGGEGTLLAFIEGPEES